MVDKDILFTIKDISLIILGWVLGILSHFLFVSSERKRKIQDFKKGFLEELKEILPLLAGLRFSVQKSLGEVDRDALTWYRDMILTKNETSIDPQITEGLEKIINLSDDQVQHAFKLLKDDPTKAKGFKKYHLPFLDTNINIVPLLGIELQRAIFRLRRLFDMLGQEIEAYNFFLQKTFDPASMDVNKDLLIVNRSSCYKSISNICLRSGNEILNLIKKLDR
jgi:hypothetical protein